VIDEVVKAMASRPVVPPAAPAASEAARTSASSARRASARKTLPPTVSVTPLALRVKRENPNSFSSARICWLSGGCWIPSAAAARVKLPASATAMQ
jgi:hypothetical protein